MVRYEDNCVGCPSGLGCLGDSCPFINTPVYYCDSCGDYAEYNIDGNDLCRECAEKYLDDLWNQSSLAEKAELLDVEFKERK